MIDDKIPTGSASVLKRRLLEALNTETQKGVQSGMTQSDLALAVNDSSAVLISEEDRVLPDGQSVYSLLLEKDEIRTSVPSDDPREAELEATRLRLQLELSQVAGQDGESHKTDFDDTLALRGVVSPTMEQAHPAGEPSSTTQKKSQLHTVEAISLESVNSGGSMADLSGYRDLSKAPISFGDDDLPSPALSAPDTAFERASHAQFNPVQHFAQELPSQEVDTEFSGNVKTLIRLVNELPEGVTKQTGAQIIRLTMEAMGISMEDVLSEAQSAQSEMLDAVRANIKKIEEYKTVIRKLETDIKYYQGKANELSEIIDLFILSNTTGQKMPSPDDLSR